MATRTSQVAFCVAVLVGSWLAMQAVHELGHVAGAAVTGGRVERVVLHPLAVSRTDVSPNPRPGVVVWLGPIVGCLVPLALWRATPAAYPFLRKLTQFVAGFCLIANGAYLAFGSLDEIGDCGEIVRSGSPWWTLPAFGVIAIPAGLFLWHGLGSPRKLWNEPSLVTPRMAAGAVSIVLVAIALELALSPR